MVAAIPYDRAGPAFEAADTDACDYASFDHADEMSRRARHGYFANISYLDDKIGELLDVLERTRMADDTVDRVLLRPWRHARRARPVVQDELLRRLRPRAADDRRRPGLVAAGASMAPVSTST
jgi:hypothetical protein